MGQPNNDLPQETVETVEEVLVDEQTGGVAADFFTLMSEDASDEERNAASQRIASSATELLVALAYARGTDKIAISITDGDSGRKWNLSLVAEEQVTQDGQE